MIRIFVDAVRFKRVEKEINPVGVEKVLCYRSAQSHPDADPLLMFAHEDERRLVVVEHTPDEMIVFIVPHYELRAPLVDALYSVLQLKGNE